MSRGSGVDQTLVDIFFVLSGFTLLMGGGEALVQGATRISQNLSVSPLVVGFTVVAVGTSLPELVVGIMSAVKRKVDFALGNILGSNIYNVLGVLGISSFFGNFSMPEILATQDLYFMLFITLLILGFMFFIKKLGRTYGSIGLILYICYMYFIFN